MTTSLVERFSHRWTPALAASIGMVCVGCSETPARPLITVDATVTDMGPRDAGSDAGDGSTPTDLGLDASPSTDLGMVDGGTVACSSGSPTELFRTAYLVGYQVPYGAAANVDGLLVAATVITEANYPFYDRIAGFMSQTGAVAGTTSISPAAMVMSSSISVAQQANGFLVLFDETPSLGMPTDLWTRSADSLGTFMGTGPTQLTSTAGSGESAPRVVTTMSGFAASWISAANGPMTAVLDTAGAIVGSSQPASASVGMPGSLETFAIAGAPYVAYFGSDQKVHGIAIGSSGAVAGTATTLSASTSTGNFGLSGGASGAGLAYEIPVAGGKTALQFRAINSNGSVSVAERTITALDEQGERPSVASLAGGYLVLYRSTPSTGSATLRLAFVAATGDRLASYDLVDAFPQAPRFSVHVSPDNEVYVVYHEDVSLTVAGGASVAGASVKAIRIVCE